MLIQAHTHIRHLVNSKIFFLKTDIAYRHHFFEKFSTNSNIMQRKYNYLAQKSLKLFSESGPEPLNPRRIILCPGFKSWKRKWWDSSESDTTHISRTFSLRSVFRACPKEEAPLREKAERISRKRRTHSLNPPPPPPLPNRKERMSKMIESRVSPLSI